MGAMEQVNTTSSVLLVDDEELVRAGLRLILEGEPSLKVVGEASNGRQGISAVRKLEPDVVLMDIRMPVLDGLGATEQLLTEWPDLKIIVLTTFDTDEFVLRALRLGARGFLLKDTVPTELVTAVRQVADGRIMLSQSVTLQLIAASGSQTDQKRRSDAVAKLTGLTGKELEIAEGIADGLSNAEIAATHFVSITTVKTHVGRILDKLGVANRVQIAICVHSARH